jgi:Cu/Ag efflux pump CusA
MVDAAIVVTENAYNRLLKAREENNNVDPIFSQRVKIITESTKEVA